MHKTCIVYVTALDPAEAETIAKTVVAERLAACANVLGEIRAWSFWQGAARNETETALLLKTATDRLDALTARIKALHSYEEPCIVAIPIIGGSQSFIDWIAAGSTPE